MALKVLLLSNKLDVKTKALEALRAKDADFEKREAELTSAIGEMTIETSDEDRATIEQQAEEFSAEKETHEADKKALEVEIEGIEAEIKKEEEIQRPVPKGEEKRGETKAMETRKFFKMNAQERSAFFNSEEVKGFLNNVRSLAGQKRSVSGAGLTVPTIILDILRENIIDYSKLYKHVNIKPVTGKARQTVMGTIPEAIWTEACAAINELDFVFSAVEVDAYKVGGFVPVCNGLLEDSEANNVALANDIIIGLLQAIGLALDKAIIYGTGVKMPMGIVTRLSQASEPSDYPQNARPWVDLRSTNVITMEIASGANFFANFIEATGAAKSAYSRGSKFWAMNEATYTKLISKAVALNAAGAFVSGVSATMPIVGGDIEVLNFIPDDEIIGGYGDLYLLAERGEATVTQSEHAQFIEDNTVFKGTARYDGVPVIAEAFVAININNTSPTTSTAFAIDTANDASLEGLQADGITIDFAATTYEYTGNVANSVTSTSVVATPSQEGAEVVIKSGAKKYANGASIPLAAGLNTVNVIVSQGAATLTYTIKVTKAS